MNTTVTRRRFVDVVDQTGITYRQADYWTRLGHIHSPAPGSGHTRYLNDTEANILRTMARLVLAGIPVSDAALISRADVEGSHVMHHLADGITLLITEPLCQGCANQPPEPGIELCAPCLDDAMHDATRYLDDPETEPAPPTPDELADEQYEAMAQAGAYDDCGHEEHQR